MLAYLFTAVRYDHTMTSIGFISSFHELIQSRGVCRLCLCVCLSVCLSVCKLFSANRFYYAKNGSIATKLAQDGQQVGAHPGYAQGQGQGQRSRDTGTFVLAQKSLLLPGKWPDCDQTCTRWSDVHETSNGPAAVSACHTRGQRVSVPGSLGEALCLLLRLQQARLSTEHP